MEEVHSASTASANYSRYLTASGRLRTFLRKRVFCGDLVRHLQGTTLDIGCGAGGFLQQNPGGIGVDSNPYVLGHCLSLGLVVGCADAYELPFRSNSFQGVLMSKVLEHLAAPLIALGEATRVLMPEGRLVVTVPTEAGFAHDETHVQFVDDRALCDMALSCGLCVEDLYRFPLGFGAFGRLLHFVELRGLFRKTC